MIFVRLSINQAFLEHKKAPRNTTYIDFSVRLSVFSLFEFYSAEIV